MIFTLGFCRAWATFALMGCVICTIAPLGLQTEVNWRILLFMFLLALGFGAIDWMKHEYAKQEQEKTNDRRSK